MARITSLSILQSGGGNDYLAEKYGQSLNNISKKTLSGRLKNMNLSGTPSSGSVEVKRFENKQSQEYGTARAAGAGAKTTAKPVTVSIDKNKELFHEIEESDIALYGYGETVIDKEVMNDEGSIKRELERAFFSVASGNARVFTTSATDIAEKIEEAIQEVETTENEFIDGVDRAFMTIVASTSTYGDLRNKLDTLQNANINTGAEAIMGFHGVAIESSVYLPKGVEFVIYVKDSVAQPLWVKVVPVQQVQFSTALSYGQVFSYGTKAVQPDLLLAKTTGVLTLTSVAGSTTGKTKITSAEGSLSGSALYYKTAASVTAPAVGDDAPAGYTLWDGTADITATAGHNLVVVEIETNTNKVIRAGKVTSVVVA